MELFKNFFCYISKKTKLGISNLKEEFYALFLITFPVIILCLNGVFWKFNSFLWYLCQVLDSNLITKFKWISSGWREHVFQLYRITIKLLSVLVNLWLSFMHKVCIYFSTILNQTKNSFPVLIFRIYFGLHFPSFLRILCLIFKITAG